MNPQIKYDKEKTFNRFLEELRLRSKGQLIEKLEEIRGDIYRELGIVDTGIYPELKIELFPDKYGLRYKWIDIYGIKRNIKAFYADKTGWIYLSAKHASIRKLSHEMAHLYTVNEMGLPPAMYAKIYEVLAWHVEKFYK